jgi:hypothetical protein
MSTSGDTCVSHVHSLFPLQFVSRKRKKPERGRWKRQRRRTRRRRRQMKEEQKTHPINPSAAEVSVWSHVVVP